MGERCVSTLALGSDDRTVVIQGVAGAGKTTLISAIASVSHQEGREVIGLAFANKMVSDLRNDTQLRGRGGEVLQAGIAAQTVSSFINQHLRGALHGSGPQFEASRNAVAGKVLILDEASLVANKPMNDLLTIANRLGAEKVIMVGDKAQLLSIEAGKAFALIQANNPAMARLDTSLRQRTPHMQEAAGLARAGQFRESFASLGERVIEAGHDHLRVTAQRGTVAVATIGHEEDGLHSVPLCPGICYGIDTLAHSGRPQNHRWDAGLDVIEDLPDHLEVMPVLLAARDDH